MGWFNLLCKCRECARILVKSHVAAPDSKLKAVYKKYSSVERGAVALHPPAVKMLEELKKASSASFS